MLPEERPVTLSERVTTTSERRLTIKNVQGTLYPSFFKATAKKASMQPTIIEQIADIHLTP